MQFRYYSFLFVTSYIACLKKELQETIRSDRIRELTIQSKTFEQFHEWTMAIQNPIHQTTILIRSRQNDRTTGSRQSSAATENAAKCAYQNDAAENHSGSRTESAKEFNHKEHKEHNRRSLAAAASKNLFRRKGAPTRWIAAVSAAEENNLSAKPSSRRPRAGAIHEGFRLTQSGISHFEQSVTTRAIAR